VQIQEVVANGAVADLGDQRRHALELIAAHMFANGFSNLKGRVGFFQLCFHHIPVGDFVA
jgi:hypothetical protein